MLSMSDDIASCIFCQFLDRKMSNVNSSNSITCLPTFGCCCCMTFSRYYLSFLLWCDWSHGLSHWPLRDLLSSSDYDENKFKHNWLKLNYFSIFQYSTWLLCWYLLLDQTQFKLSCLMTKSKVAGLSGRLDQLLSDHVKHKLIKFNQNFPFLTVGRWFFTRHYLRQVLS